MERTPSNGVRSAYDRELRCAEGLKRTTEITANLCFCFLCQLRKRFSAENLELPAQG